MNQDNMKANQQNMVVILTVAATASVSAIPGCRFDL